MSVQGHSRSSLKGQGNQKRLLKTGRKNTPLKRTRTKILGATDQLASFQSWEGAGATDPENHFQTYEEQEGDCK